MGLFRLAVGLIKQIENLLTDNLRRYHVDCQVEHHTDAGHRRTKVVGYHRVHLVAVRDGTLQLFILLHNDTFGGHQLNLVHHTHHQLFFIERLGQEVVGTHLETLDKV